MPNLSITRLDRPVLGLYRPHFLTDQGLTVVEIDGGDIPPGSDLLATHAVGTDAIHVEPGADIAEDMVRHLFAQWYATDPYVNGRADGHDLGLRHRRDENGTMTWCAPECPANAVWREQASCYCPPAWYAKDEHAEGCQFAH